VTKTADSSHAGKNFQRQSFASLTRSTRARVHFAAWPATTTDCPSSTEPEIRLQAVWGAIHGLEEKRAALCISGGGTRSATFGLGILQGLARHSLLEKFHYLSTVSGGGYIGGWLTAWIHRADGGLKSVITDLTGSTAAARPNPEPVAIQNLRSYSNYLSPRLGEFSADSEPRDIYESSVTNKNFPHEGTKDQFFSESQFESYRMLGSYTMEKLCADQTATFATSCA
jgi:hypothetical protein